MWSDRHPRVDEVRTVPPLRVSKHSVLSRAAQRKKAIIHQVITMLATPQMSYFQVIITC